VDIKSTVRVVKLYAICISFLCKGRSGNWIETGARKGGFST